MRRGAAAAVVLLTALLLCACGHAEPERRLAASARHPNIVFVLADDLSMNLVEHMPNVQRMREEGREFTRTTVDDSLCCPSRASIFTGRLPHNTGVFANSGSDGGLDAYRANGNEDRSFAVPLADAGYRTAFMGKYLNGYHPGQDDPPPGWDRWIAAGGGGYNEYGYDLDVDGQVVRRGHRPQDYLVDVLSRNAASFIRSSAASDRAFLLEVAPFAPHSPYTPPIRYENTMLGLPYPRTAAYDAEVAGAPSWLRGHRSLTSPEKIRMQAIWERRVEASLAVDDLIGELRETIAEAGVEDETIVVFTSDNGFHMGEYRLTPGKQTAFDTDVRVPLVVTAPGVEAASTSDALVSNIDLAPTFLELAGVGPDPDADGESLVPLLRGDPGGSSRAGVLIEHHHEEGLPDDPDLQNARNADPPDYAAVRTADALYVRNANGEQEYYDTDADPEQLHNRAGEGVPPRLVRLLEALEGCSGAASCRAAARTP